MLSDQTKKMLKIGGIVAAILLIIYIAIYLSIPQTYTNPPPLPPLPPPPPKKNPLSMKKML